VSFSNDGNNPARTSEAVKDTPPTVCPACDSTAIATTAKIPDVNSYWRCAACGEVWNVARRHARRGANKWW
jgi:transposase-like protein